MSEEPEVQAAETAETKRPNWRQVKAERAAAAAAEAPVQSPGGGSRPNMPPGRVLIQLEENDNIPPTGQFFGVNGASFLLSPGVEVSVPQGLVDILDHAEMAVPVLDPNTKQVIGWRKKLRYPYRVITRSRVAA